MPAFSYKAVSSEGLSVRGVEEAADREGLVVKLRANDLFLVSFSPVEEKKNRKKRLKPMEISDFSRQLGMMISSGVTLLRAVDIISKRDIKPGIRNIYADIGSCLRRGIPLWEAMSLQNGAFPDLIVNMFAAGEASGKLDRAALKMSSHYEKEHKLKSKIRSAMTYPTLLIIVSIVVVLFLFTLVLPKFFSIFEGVELPFATRLLMDMSRALVNNWPMILVTLFLMFIAIKTLLSFENVKLKIDKFKIKLPIIGRLMKIIYTSRFARTLSSLYSSGIVMMKALEITRGTIGNAYIASQFDNLLSEVRQGSSLAKALAKIDGFDTKLSATVTIGEETGKLDEMLESTADSFDYEAEEAATKLTTIIEPVLIVFMAMVVGFIMIAVLLPIYDMYGNISPRSGD